jgi:D-alanyl-D-alanine carboxypeptidase
VAREDLVRQGSRLDGDDLLALVNRTPIGALPPDYAPDDLVDVATMRVARAWQCTPPTRQCLRREAARAYARMAAAMHDAGLRPYVSSAFRAYRVQCSTFTNWAERERDGFCAAATASALPGHSQHQLGTTLDVFTYDWAAGGDKFRSGFGCTDAGRWLAEHAHEHGFVLPYPLHPDYRRDGSECAAIERGEERIDPRTGYRYEPWHVRYVGLEAAARFDRAWRESRQSVEITLEQWLRRERGEGDPVGAPVCDGCNCDRCATFSRGGETPCAQPALVLDAEGRPLRDGAAPRLVDAQLRREGGRLLLEARVDVSQNTLTQPPIVTPASGAFFRRGEREVQLLERDPRAFSQLPDAWRLAVGFDDAGRTWPWKVALVDPARDDVPNGINARMPAPPGEVELRVEMEGVAPGTTVRVGLAAHGEVREGRRLRAP